MSGSPRLAGVLRRGLAIAAVLIMQFSVGRAQEAVANLPVLPQTVLPPLMRVVGTAPNRAGDRVEMLFRFYGQAGGGEPVWSEKQWATVDAQGQFAVLLGEATLGGLPSELFGGGQARWLGISIEQGEEQPRVRMGSVPYAFKAGDAESLSGRRATEYVTKDQLASRLANVAASLSAQARPADQTGAGVPNYIAYWSGSTTLGASALYQGGTAAAPLVGIGTTSPNATLDVAGAGILRGGLMLPALDTATTTGGGNSANVQMTANSYNSMTRAGVDQTFSWQAVAASNNTPAASANLQLKFATGAGVQPAATGLSISPAGIVTFAAGQMFPGTGSGTISAIMPGVGLTGGGTGGSVSLAVDTTKVPMLASANSFQGNQTIVGNLIVTGQIISRLATGTAPLSVNSTTVVPNLNASFVNGAGASQQAAVGKNLYNYQSPTLTTGALHGSGTIDTSIGVDVVSDLMPVGGLSYVITNHSVACSGGYCSVWYDLNGNYLRAVGPGLLAGVPMAVPPDAGFLRIFARNYTGMAEIPQEVIAGNVLPVGYVPFDWNGQPAYAAAPGCRIGFIGDSITATYGYWINPILIRTGCVKGYEDAVNGRGTSNALNHYSARSPDAINLGGNTGPAGNTLSQDLATLSVMLIEEGTDDQHIPTGSVASAAWDGTEYGNVRGLIETLQSANPGMRILWVTPYYQNTAVNPYLDSIRGAIEYECQQHGIPYLDLVTTSGINVQTLSMTLEPDQIHPQPSFSESRLGPQIANWVKSFL